MATRLVLGSTMVTAILGLFVLDHFLGVRTCVSALIVLLGLAGWGELAALAGIASRERGGGAGLFLVGLAATAYFLGVGWWESASPQESRLLVPGGIVALVAMGFACTVFRRDYEKRFQPLLMTVVGALLFGLLFSYLLRIYHLPRGTLWGLVFFLGVKGNDIAAYLVGRTLGRVRFLAVSPKKSLEGCLAAVAFSVLWFSGAAMLWPEAFFPWPWGIPVGIILSVSTQVGDLSESLIKRCYQVKDSSRLLPELGGVLDLIDSTLFSGYLFWIVGALLDVPA
ncbi:MAG: phosphatidate cytidylyltransferase [Planctomycetes bacterium]|nr:phosphatidate cytidylyltransferase [Planctomycetota bacterium]